MTNEKVGCICPRAIRSLGILHGISMGKGMVRLETAPGCLVHDPRSHPWVPHVIKPWCIPSCRDMCHQCGARRKGHGT